jgi:hypothetical protein
VLGARRLEIAHTQYHGWAYRNRHALMPTPEQVRRAGEIAKAAAARLQGVMAIDYVTPDHLARYPKPCMGGWGRVGLNVTPTGKVLPCHAAETITGLAFETVRDRPLAGDLGGRPGLRRLSRDRLDARPVQELRPPGDRLGRLPLPGLRLDRRRRGDRPGLHALPRPCPHARRRRGGGRRDDRRLRLSRALTGAATDPDAAPDHRSRIL